VGSGARDRHGNNLALGRTVIFTTAATFPPGRLAGAVQAVGFKAPGALIWLYRDGHAPDSTAKDFDALGIVDARGEFRVAGLRVPATWRAWAFVDMNGNRSFEPDVDLLAPADSAVLLTREHPEFTGINIHVVNPHAQARFAGAVVDSVSDGSGPVRLIVSPAADSTRRLLYEVPANGGFDFKFDAGKYRIRAFRDLDRSKSWQRATEPASREELITIEPGVDLTNQVFVLLRPGAAERNP